MKHFSFMDRPQSHSDLSASHLKLTLHIFNYCAIDRVRRGRPLNSMSVVEQTLNNNLPTNTFIPHGFC